MKDSYRALPVAAREELEDYWRGKLEEARERFEVASRQYRRLLDGAHGQRPAAGSPLALARQHQTEALMEFRHILRIFTELAVEGRIPEEESPGRSNGVGHERDRSDFCS